ncbi:MAG: glycosyltransferase family 2 protein [Hominilimicola sp.]
MEKAVSVIVPVFNGGSTIKRCIESILNQTLSGIEIIVVDDGSEDNTLSFLRSFTDDRLTIITQNNAGQGFARNLGLEIAKGKYIAFADADDAIESAMLEEMYKRAERDSADMVQCNILDIYPDGSKRVQLEATDETVNITDKGEYTDRYFTPCCHSYEVCNKLIRRSIIENSGLKFRDTRKYFSEDLMFNLELINHLKTVSFISAPYYNYYQNENSHLHRNAKKRLVSLCELFRAYISQADETMKNAASYTAAMIITYNAGFCVENHKETAKAVLSGKELRSYISAALKRKCKLKHRIFLSAMRIMPVNVRLTLAQIYSERWRI